MEKRHERAGKMRNDLETKLGEKLFLIADARDRASEISFYLREKRVEGPGHPPVYIPESQDMVNQFSFWPRYDEFVEIKPGTPRPESEVYTEESGINLFIGRDALFIRDGEKATRATQHQGRHFNRPSWLARLKCRATGSHCAHGRCFSVEITAHSRYEKPSSKAPRRGHSSGAKDLTRASLITLGKQRDASSVGKVPHFVRDDAHPIQRCRLPPDAHDPDDKLSGNFRRGSSFQRRREHRHLTIGAERCAEGTRLRNHFCR